MQLFFKNGVSKIGILFPIYSSGNFTTSLSNPLVDYKYPSCLQCGLRPPLWPSGAPRPFGFSIPPLIFQGYGQTPSRKYKNNLYKYIFNTLFRVPSPRQVNTIKICFLNSTLLTVQVIFIVINFKNLKFRKLLAACNINLRLNIQIFTFFTSIGEWFLI